MEPEQSTTPEVKEIKWLNAKRKVKNLKFHPDNPRIIKEDDVAELKKIIKRDGYRDPVSCNLNDVLISGHKRVSVFMYDHRDEEEIDVRIPSRLLTDEEHKLQMLTANKFGTESANWDWDKLNNEYEESMLAEAGFSENDLAGYAKEVDEEIEKAGQELQEREQIICPECGARFTQ